MTNYAAKLDTAAIIISAIITVLFAAIIGWQWLIVASTCMATPLFTTAICVLIYLIAYLLRPVKYTLTGDELIVHRPLKSVRVKRLDITHVAAISRKEIFGSFRAFGIGGLFGYVGSFVNASVGRMTWYATNLHCAVLIITVTGKRIIVTPEERERFIAALKS